MFKRTPHSTLRLAIAIFAAATACAQSVSEQDGRIYFTDQNGIRKPVTDGRHDSQPYLSFDGQQVVFVRRIPGRTTESGVSELWIATVDGGKPPKRVLSGGNYIDAPGSIVLGFQNPKLSPDATRVYFEGDLWATAAAIKVLDVATGSTKLLFPGVGVDVIRTGKYRGFLIGTKAPLTKDRGRIMVDWLLNPNGKEVTRIGENDSGLDRFKRIYDIR